MVSALDSEASGLDLNPGRGHYVVFGLARKQFTITVYYHSASLHPGV